jgi:glucuronoarabinoxylan endo-1,4-beta-xylanase
MEVVGAMNRVSASITMVCLAWGCAACGNGGGVSPGGSGGVTSSGGAGASQSGGAGATGSGGTLATGGAKTTPSDGSATDDAPASGGATSDGGKALGGTTSTGGKINTGGGPGGAVAGNTGGLRSGGATGSAGAKTGGASAQSTGGMGTSRSSAGGATTPPSGTGGTTGATDAGAGGGSGGSTGVVTVQLDKTKQTIEGFGINDTWAAEVLPSRLFSTTDVDGLGLSIVRIGMSEDGSDYTSSAAADAKLAKDVGGKVIGTCWSPPADCKTNNTVDAGGHLKPDCYESWANTIAAWAKAHGLYAMSLQNEPDYQFSCGAEPCSGSSYPGTLYSAEELAAFVKVVGPKLRALAPPVKLIAPETSEWLHLWTNNTIDGGSDPLDGHYDYGHALAKDPEAWAALDILGTHQYETQVGEAWPSDVPQTKQLWMTEMSGVKRWPEEGPSSDIKNGVAVAGWIHSALVVGDASAWLWWWYRAYGTDDNEGLLLKSGTMTKRYYTLGNYSRFIRPGYVRVEVAGTVATDVLLSAYKGSDGALVVVAINKGSTTVTVPMAIAGGTAPASLTPNVTSSGENLKAGTAVAVTGGSFTATLASMTVTTFVGN